MAETLDAALEALQRSQFYEAMARAEAELRAQPAEWARYIEQRERWLGPELDSRAT